MWRMSALALLLVLGACSTSSTPNDTSPSLPVSSAVATVALERTADSTDVVPVGSVDRYSVDCGPVDRSLCPRLVQQVVDLSTERFPDRTVVEIVFSSHCGSYELLFDDGTGMGAALDCIAPPSDSP